MAEREGLGVKKLLKEFETFIMRGNVIDMAVGVIVGAAFQAIVNSLVNDVISPLLGLVANMDLSYLVLKINDVEIRYGAFVTAVINFLIMAFVIFLLVKAINKISELGFKKKKEEEKCRAHRIIMIMSMRIMGNAARPRYIVKILYYLITFVNICCKK